MRYSKLTAGVLGATAMLLVTSACGSDVTKPVDPVELPEPLLPSEVTALALGSWRSYFQTHTAAEGNLIMAIAADVLTSHLPNWGMRWINVEPRTQLGNGTDPSIRLTVPWDGYYKAIGDANEVLYAMRHRGVEMPDPHESRLVETLARLTQASAYSQLALMFDQAFIVDEDTLKATLEDPVNFDVGLQPYQTVAQVARGYWEDVISLNESATWSIWSIADPQPIMPVHQGSGESLSPTYLSRLANTMAARLLAYTPRTAAQNGQVDWAAVLAYARNGVTDIDGNGPGIVLEYGPGWMSDVNLYGTNRSWVRVDHRIINMMAPNIPATFDLSEASHAIGISPDARYGTDFVHAGDIVGNPLIGAYMMSTHYQERWEDFSSPFSPIRRGEGSPLPFVLPAENNLLIAEALIRTGGDLGTAAHLINITRVGRGNLAPATAAEGKAKLLEHLLYERYVELMNTGSVELYDARRFDDLQSGTWRHLPVPARELERLGLPIHTFGGAGPDM